MHNEFKDDVTGQISAAHIKALCFFCLLNSTVQIEILTTQNWASNETTGNEQNKGQDHLFSVKDA